MTRGKRFHKSRAVFSLTLTRSLFFAFTAVVLAVLAAIWSVADRARKNEADATAQEKLGSSILQAETELHSLFNQVDRMICMTRDWMLSGITETSDRVALNQLFIPLLRSTPQLASITIARNDGFEYFLYQNNDTWRTRSLYPGGNEKDVLWARWAGDGIALLQEQREPLEYDPRREIWYQESMNRCRNRPDRNREGRPAAYIGEPKILDRDQTAVMNVSFAVPGANNTQYAMRLEIRLDAIKDISARLHDSRNASILISYSTGQVLGQPGKMRIQSEHSQSLLAVKDINHPVARAYEKWRANPARDHRPFPVEEGEQSWWCAFRVFALSSDAFLYIGAGERSVSDTPYAEMEQYAMAGIALAGLLLSAIMAQILGSGFRRPIRAFVRRARGMERASSYMVLPGSPIAEFQELSEACEQMACLIEERVHELARLSESMQESHALPPRAAEIQPPDVIEAHLCDVSETSPEEDPLISGMIDPPRTFLQAMRTTRRRLRAAEDRLDVLNTALHTQTERLCAYEERLRSQREALSALNSRETGSNWSWSEALSRITETALNTMDLDRASIWALETESSSIRCIACSSAGERHDCQNVCLPSGVYSILLRSLHMDDVLRILDAPNDPRVRAWPREHETQSMLFAGVRKGVALHYLIVLEYTGGPRQWHADEENYVFGLAQLLAHWCAEIRPV